MRDNNNNKKLQQQQQNACHLSNCAFIVNIINTYSKSNQPAKHIHSNATNTLF